MIADGNLYCNYCNCNVNWIHKSDVLRHTQAAKHAKALQRLNFRANSSISVSGNLGDVLDSDPGEGTNKLVCSSRLSPSDESVRVLHSAA